MQASKLSLIVAASLALADAGHATDVPTVGDLDLIQAETILLKARTKREEARNELASKSSAGGIDDGALPVVKSILGSDRQVVATLIYPGNVQIGARIGDAVPGGYRVSKINQDTDTVELVKGKETFTVGMSSIAPAGRSRAAGEQHSTAPGPYVPGLVR